MSLRSISAAAALLLLFEPSSAAAGVGFIPPVDAPTIVRFTQPRHEWAPGHRGIDYAVAPGTRVRAAGEGTVTFAGAVAGRLAVTIRHDLGYETTYTALGEISVTAGRSVAQGEWIGSSDRAHPGGQPGLHFGVKHDGDYIDPQSVLGAVDVAEAIHLAPLVWQPPRDMPDAFRSAFADAGTAERLCRAVTPVEDAPRVAPNENVAVAIAGIGSSTRGGVSADMYEHGPEELGYAYDRIYRFSYAGVDRDDLHLPYASTDTYGDIAGAAQRLRHMLRKIARAHPGRNVDLITHSMGGLVARRLLVDSAEQPALPRIEHLVTFATPHDGSSLAHLPDALDAGTLTGSWLVDGASGWARRGGPIPDPRSPAVEQLAPGSAFLADLAREGVAYGTRVLALGIGNDVVVTADRALWDEASSRTVAPSGFMGHSAIVESAEARALAYAFLRDASPSCPTNWDLWGPRLGRATGFAEENSYRALAAAEEATLGRVLRVGKAVDRFVDGRLGRVARKVAGKLVHRTAIRVLHGPR